VRGVLLAVSLFLLAACLPAVFSGAAVGGRPASAGEGRWPGLWRQVRSRLLDRAPDPIPATIDVEATDLYKAAPRDRRLEVMADHVLRVPGRQRPIPLRITLPARRQTSGAALHPIIIFCHGALGSREGYQPLVRYWAGHGYAIIQPTFGDSLALLDKKKRRRIRSLGELVSSDHVISQWDDRPIEVSAVIDALPELEAALPAIEGRLDRERIAVAGHSYGAHTGMMLLGLELVGPEGRRARLPDERIDAAYLISPLGPGGSIRPEAYRRLDRPALFVTGGKDASPMPGRREKAGAWRRKAFDLAPPGDRYLLWIDQAHHGFGGISSLNWPGAGPAAPDQVLLVRSVGLAFFDAFLRGEASARRFLEDRRGFEEEAGHLGHLEKRLAGD